MPAFPNYLVLINQNNIGTHSPESIIGPLNGMAASLAASIAWPIPSGTIFVPVEIYQPVTIVKLLVNNGTSVSGNIDVGIYDSFGNKIVSSGSTAQINTSSIQAFDITDTLLLPGLYYMGVSLDNGTGTLSGWTTVVVDVLPAGVLQQAGIFPLPSIATFAPIAQTMVPWVSMTQKAIV